MAAPGGSHRPPLLAVRLLRRLIGQTASEADPRTDQIETSLEELFRVRAERGSVRSARLWYWRQVIGFALRRRALRGSGAPPRLALQPSLARGVAQRPEVMLGGWVSGGSHSIGQALRGLRRSPGLAVMVILTLALGIGANTAVFSVVNSVLLNPLPYEGADRIFRDVWQYLPDSGFSIGLPYERAMELRQRSETLERLEVFDDRSGVLGVGDDAGPVTVGHTTPGLFDGLNLDPRLGRNFVAADAEPGAENVVMLGEALWRGRFGASEDVIGDVMSVDGAPRVVVGVVDGSIRHLASDVDLWLPMREPPSTASSSTILAWRHPDISVQQARAEMEVLAFDDERYGRTVARLVLPADRVADETQALLYATLAAVSLVLLIACVNVAHLMLTRGSARRHEIAVRAALGAGRRRIAGELLLESGLLALAGGALGILFATWCIDLLIASRPDSLRIALDNVRLDGTVMAYAAGLSMLAAVIAGLAPIFDSWRRHPAEAMRRSGVDGGSGTVARGGRRLARQGLLVGEVALSLMLLIGAGLLVHSLVRLQRADPGYDVGGLSTVPVRVAAGSSPGELQLADLHEQMLEVVRGTGGVAAATLASTAPVTDMVFSGALEIEATGEVHERVRASLTGTAPGYFSALGIPILEGRDFSAADIGAQATAVIINRTFAARYFAGTSAVGKVFRRSRGDSVTSYRIVGVAGDAVQLDPLETEYDLQLYQPLWRFNLRPTGAGDAPQPLRMSLLVRVRPAPRAPFELLAERLRPLGAELDVGGAHPVRDRLSRALDGPRFNAVLFTAFAAIAIGLASIGLYGVVSHAVERRAREIGIRVAIGARTADVRRLVLRQGMGPVIVGVLLGLAGAAAAGRVIAGILYLVEPLDPLVFALVPALLLLVALAAIWVPVVRATRVDPVAVLRAE